LVNYIREYQLKRGVPNEAAYSVTMYILAGLLLLGFLANILVRPVAAKHFMTEEELTRERQLGHEKGNAAVAAPAAASLAWHPRPTSWVAVAVGWTLIGIPLAWGILQTVEKAAALFK
jgi:hypothetical protein